jgi:hypothetical protein
MGVLFEVVLLLVKAEVVVWLHKTLLYLIAYRHFIPH